MSNARQWPSEAEMCDAFTSRAGAAGWTVYPETAGWDMLLVRDGQQLGVQAKLRANLKVIIQALDGHDRRCGPDYRAVLIGECHHWDVTKVCSRLKLVSFWFPAPAPWDHHMIGEDKLLAIPEEYRWNHEAQHSLPPVVPRVRAGVPSPSTVSHWCIGAMRLLARASIRGWVTSRDAKEVGVDIKLFVTRSWIYDTGEKAGALHKYALDLDDGRPDSKHPAEFQEILAEQRLAMAKTVEVTA